MESALQQTDQSLLRTIIDSSPDWIFIKDLQHRFVMANALFARTLGRGVEDLIGKTDLDFGVPEELVKGNPDKGIRGFWADDDEVVQTGRTKIIAQESILIDGREHILSTTKIPLKNDRHEVWGILVFVYDITLYKQTENALRESEQRYRKLFAEAERKSKELMLLDKLQSALVNKLELDVLFKTIVTSIFDIFRYERILITFLADQRMLTGPYHGYVSLPESFSVDDGITGLAALSGRPMLVENVAEHPAYHPLEPDVLSNLCLPFFAGGKVMGVLVIETTTKPLAYNDLDLLTKVSEQISLAVENARLHQQTKTDLVRTKALYQVSRAITSADSLPALMDQVAGSTLDALAARWVFVYKLDIDMQAIDYVACMSHSDTPLESVSYEELWQGLSGLALNRQQPVLSKKNQPDTLESETVRTRRRTHHIGSIVVAPLIYKGKPMGTITALNHEDDADFDQSSIDTLMAVANQVVVALEQHQLFEKLEHQAYHDALTNLPNRLLFQDRLKFSIEHARLHEQLFALLFVDLDSFKHINDTLGHHIGDQILQQVGDRLRSQVRTSDTLARMGGDEFALILTGLHANTDARQVAGQYLELFQKPFVIEHRELFLTASIGISLFPQDGEDAITLLRHADSAMYQAKGAGKNNVQSFTRELSRQTRRRLDVELELRRALDKNELELFYQPQIDLSDGSVVGFEALLRWQNQKFGWISPAEFIPIAEDTGLILPIGEWVLCQACVQTGIWRQAGKPRWQMAVNVSPHQFIRPDFVDTVIGVIGTSGIDPANLELEITESVVMHDIARVADKLNRLRELGVSIAIDDFGTGYSSLRYLQQLPIDKLKIDQSFMHDIKSEQDQSMLIDTFIMLSANLGFKVIAEGVETREQLAYLKKINCHQVQGFYFAKPMPATQAASVMSYALTAGHAVTGG